MDTLPIQIPNGTHQIIINLPNITNQINIPSDPITTLWLPTGLVISTLALAAITGIGIWRTLRHTRRSNDLLSKEISARIRPILYPLKFIPSYVTLSGGGMDYEKWGEDPKKFGAPISVKVAMKLKNTGLIPAKNFQFKGIMRPNKEYTRKEIEDEKYQPNIRIVFPNEEFDADITLDYNIFKIQETGELWTAFMAKYDIDEETEQEVGYIGYLTKGSSRKRLTWSEEKKKNKNKKP